MKKKEIRNYFKGLAEHYESEDFKDNYAFLMFEDKEQVSYSLKQALKWDEFTGLDENNLQYFVDWITENYNDYIQDYYNYYVGYFCLDSVIFGEQEEQIEKSTFPNFKKMKEIADDEGFYISGDKYDKYGYTCAYYNLSGDGLKVCLSQQMINDFLEETTN